MMLCCSNISTLFGGIAASSSSRLELQRSTSDFRLYIRCASRDRRLGRRVSGSRRDPRSAAGSREGRQVDGDVPIAGEGRQTVVRAPASQPVTE